MKQLSLHFCLKQQLHQTPRKAYGQKQELQTAEEREKLKRTADLITANLYAIKPGDKSVTLTDYFDPELPQVKVELDPLLTPQQNAQRLFGKYTRLKRAEEALTRQIEMGQQELEYVNNVLYTLSAAQDASQIKEIREELIQAGYVKPTEKGKRKPKPQSAEQEAAPAAAEAEESENQ